MTYYEFIKSQSKAFQDEALGTKDAESFRNGELSVTKFKESPKPMTIEQLEASHELSITNPED